MTITFFDLVAAMRQRTQVVHHDPKTNAPIKGFVNKIEVEDGSGRRWLVTMSVGDKNVIVYWDEQRNPLCFVQATN